MAYEDLLKSVEESAAEQEKELRRKAQEASLEIRERAKKQAESVRLAHVAEARRSAATERNKALYLTNVENKEQLIRTREASFDKAFSLARDRLSGLRAGPDYPGVFARLLQEAVVPLAGQAFIVHVDPRDEPLCRKTIEQLKIAGEIRTDLEAAGGVVVSLPDNSVVISNTVESRLAQVKERQRHVIHATLSGD